MTSPRTRKVPRVKSAWVRLYCSATRSAINCRRALCGLDHLGHGVGLAGAGDAEQNLRSVLTRNAFDQFLDRGGLVALRLVFGLDDEAHAAFGFLRARRAMRRPDFHLAVLAFEFRAAFADQAFQRIRGGGDAERLHLVARRPCQRGGVFLLGGEAELLCKLRIERRNGGGGAVIGLRRFVEALPGRSTPTLALPRKRERGRRLRLRGQVFSVRVWGQPSGALSRLRGRVGWG